MELVKPIKDTTLDCMNDLISDLEHYEQWFDNEEYCKEELQWLKGWSERIKEDLLELKAIKEANPSETMDKLQNLRLYQCGACEHHHCLKCDVYKNFNAVNQYLLKAQELEKELADVEKVKSGKIIIYFGKDLVMMNKNKYYDYLELEKEPISKRILQAKCEELEKENTELNQHIKRWHDLLLKTGINSKGTVVDEIENYWQIKVEAKNER